RHRDRNRATDDIGLVFRHDLERDEHVLFQRMSLLTHHRSPNPASLSFRPPVSSCVLLYRRAIQFIDHPSNVIASSTSLTSRTTTRLVRRVDEIHSIGRSHTKAATCPRLHL